MHERREGRAGAEATPRHSDVARFIEYREAEGAVPARLLVSIEGEPVSIVVEDTERYARMTPNALLRFFPEYADMGGEEGIVIEYGTTDTKPPLEPDATPSEHRAVYADTMERAKRVFSATATRHEPLPKVDGLTARGENDPIHGISAPPLSEEDAARLRAALSKKEGGN